MKLSFQIVFAFISILIGSCTSDQNPVNRTSANDDLSRVIYLFDGKQESLAHAKQKIENGPFEVLGFASDSRDALLRYGEKYRYGVYILVTKKEESSK